MNTVTKPSVAELLKPRYRVILDYPESIYKVGQILQGQSYIKYPPHGGKFPHIFQPIEWWEERSESELPEYVKDIETGQVGKVFRWRNDYTEVFVDFKDNCCSTKFYIPSTESEYSNNKKQL